METSLLLIVIYLTIRGYCGTCKYYVCENDLEDLCMKFNNDYISIKSCGNFCLSLDNRNNICGLNDTIYTCVAASKKLPGERAMSVDECYPECTFDKEYCVGRKAQKRCDLDNGIYCDIGLYCDENYYCQITKKEGEFCSFKTKCATYLICNTALSVPVCTYPYSIEPGNLASTGDLCTTGWIDSSYKCKPISNLLSETVYGDQVDAINLCKYDDGTTLDGTCLTYSGSKNETVICIPYDQSRVELLKKVNKYMQRKPECAEGELNVFCGKATDEIDSCEIRDAMDGIYMVNLLSESRYPSCWQKKHELTKSMYICSSEMILVNGIGLVITLILFL